MQINEIVIDTADQATREEFVALLESLPHDSSTITEICLYWYDDYGPHLIAGAIEKTADKVDYSDGWSSIIEAWIAEEDRGE